MTSVSPAGFGPAPSGGRSGHRPVGLPGRRSDIVGAHAKRVDRTCGVPADVAQLVERNLAKVEVASSSLVVRSEKMVTASVVEWPRGEATDCKSVYTGPNPVSTSK